jgi:hypothetical protein
MDKLCALDHCWMEGVNFATRRAYLMDKRAKSKPLSRKKGYKDNR